MTCETYVVSLRNVTCFGILDSDALACSGHGTCGDIDICQCDLLYSGPQCEFVLWYYLRENLKNSLLILVLVLLSLTLLLLLLCFWACLCRGYRKVDILLNLNRSSLKGWNSYSQLILLSEEIMSVSHVVSRDLSDRIRGIRKKIKERDLEATLEGLGGLFRRFRDMIIEANKWDASGERRSDDEEEEEEGEYVTVGKGGGSSSDSTYTVAVVEGGLLGQTISVESVDSLIMFLDTKLTDYRHETCRLQDGVFTDYLSWLFDFIENPPSFMLRGMLDSKGQLLGKRGSPEAKRRRVLLNARKERMDIAGKLVEIRRGLKKLQEKRKKLEAERKARKKKSKSTSNHVVAPKSFSMDDVGLNGSIGDADSVLGRYVELRDIRIEMLQNETVSLLSEESGTPSSMAMSSMATTLQDDGTLTMAKAVELTEHLKGFPRDWKRVARREEQEHFGHGGRRGRRRGRLESDHPLTQEEEEEQEMEELERFQLEEAQLEKDLAFVNMFRNAKKKMETMTKQRSESLQKTYERIVSKIRENIDANEDWECEFRVKQLLELVNENFFVLNTPFNILHSFIQIMYLILTTNENNFDQVIVPVLRCVHVFAQLSLFQQRWNLVQMNATDRNDLFRLCDIYLLKFADHPRARFELEGIQECMKLVKDTSSFIEQFISSLKLFELNHIISLIREKFLLIQTKTNLHNLSPWYVSFLKMQLHYRLDPLEVSFFLDFSPGNWHLQLAHVRYLGRIALNLLRHTRNHDYLPHLTPGRKMPPLTFRPTRMKGAAEASSVQDLINDKTMPELLNVLGISEGEDISNQESDIDFVRWFVLDCIRRKKGLAEEERKKRETLTIPLEDIEDLQIQLRNFAVEDVAGTRCRVYEETHRKIEKFNLQQEEIVMIREDRTRRGSALLRHRPGHVDISEMTFKECFDLAPETTEEDRIRIMRTLQRVMKIEMFTTLPTEKRYTLLKVWRIWNTLTDRLKTYADEDVLKEILDSICGIIQAVSQKNVDWGVLRKLLKRRKKFVARKHIKKVEIMEEQYYLLQRYVVDVVANVEFLELTIPLSKKQYLTFFEPEPDIVPEGPTLSIATLSTLPEEPVMIESKDMDWLYDVLNEPKRRYWLLHGIGGSGKSCLLRHLAYKFFFDSEFDTFPIFLKCDALCKFSKEWVHNIDSTEAKTDILIETLMETCEEKLSRFSNSQLIEFKIELKNVIRTKSVVLLLDGFDEVPMIRRSSFSTMLQYLLKEEKIDIAKIIVTSRPVDKMRQFFPMFSFVGINRLSDVACRELLRSILLYGSFNVESIMLRFDACRIEHNGNPLILVLLLKRLLNTESKDDENLRKKFSLYESLMLSSIQEDKLRKHHVESSIANCSDYYIMNILSLIAYINHRMTYESKSEIIFILNQYVELVVDAEKWLAEVQNPMENLLESLVSFSGILANQKDSLTFTHRTIQEFFCARFLINVQRNTSLAGLRAAFNGTEDLFFSFFFHEQIWENVRFFFDNYYLGEEQEKIIAMFRISFETKNQLVINRMFSHFVRLFGKKPLAFYYNFLREHHLPQYYLSNRFQFLDEMPNVNIRKHGHYFFKVLSRKENRFVLLFDMGNMIMFDFDAMKWHNVKPGLLFPLQFDGYEFSHPEDIAYLKKRMVLRMFFNQQRHSGVHVFQFENGKKYCFVAYPGFIRINPIIEGERLSDENSTRLLIFGSEDASLTTCDRAPHKSMIVPGVKLPYLFNVVMVHEKYLMFVFVECIAFYNLETGETSEPRSLGVANHYAKVSCNHRDNVIALDRTKSGEGSLGVLDVYDIVKLKSKFAFAFRLKSHLEDSCLGCISKNVILNRRYIVSFSKTSTVILWDTHYLIKKRIDNLLDGHIPLYSQLVDPSGVFICSVNGMRFYKMNVMETIAEDTMSPETAETVSLIKHCYDHEEGWKPLGRADQLKQLSRTSVHLTRKFFVGINLVYKVIDVYAFDLSTSYVSRVKRIDLHNHADVSDLQVFVVKDRYVVMSDISKNRLSLFDMLTDTLRIVLLPERSVATDNEVLDLEFHPSKFLFCGQTLFIVDVEDPKLSVRVGRQNTFAKVWKVRETPQEVVVLGLNPDNVLLAIEVQLPDMIVFESILKDFEKEGPPGREERRHLIVKQLRPNARFFSPSQMLVYDVKTKEFEIFHWEDELAEIRGTPRKKRRQSTIKFETMKLEDDFLDFVVLHNNRYIFINNRVYDMLLGRTVYRAKHAYVCKLSRTMVVPITDPGSDDSSRYFFYYRMNGNLMEIRFDLDVIDKISDFRISNLIVNVDSIRTYKNLFEMQSRYSEESASEQFQSLMQTMEKSQQRMESFMERSLQSEARLRVALEFLLQDRLKESGVSDLDTLIFMEQQRRVKAEDERLAVVDGVSFDPEFVPSVEDRSQPEEIGTVLLEVDDFDFEEEQEEEGEVAPKKAVTFTEEAAAESGSDEEYEEVIVEEVEEEEEEEYEGESEDYE